MALQGFYGFMDNKDSEKLKISSAYDMLLMEIKEAISFAKSNMGSKDYRTFIKLEEYKNIIIELKRKFHMMKGGAGFFGFEKVGKLAGEVENLFETLINEKTKESSKNINYDKIKELILAIELEFEKN